MRRTCVVLAASAILSGTIAAQEAGSRAPTVMIRLFPLEYISNADAAKLVAPFVPQYPGYGVFEPGAAVRGVTVKGPKEIIDRVDSILKANDRSPPTVVLRFQLIAALDSAVRDPNIPEDVQASLRELFRFGGYRLLAQGSTSVGTSLYNVTMAFNTERYAIQGMVGDIRVRPRGTGTRPEATSSVELNVSLNGTFDTRAPNGTVTGRQTEGLLSTGLTVPIGQTVVLGSAAASEGRRALILTVRPEILNERR